ncbi:hypothetical protein GCM10009122_11230 [Fulvivirga kasyanovii]
MSHQIIHIGIDKTGSTFLQDQVFPLVEKYKYYSPGFTKDHVAFRKITGQDGSLYSHKDIKEDLNELVNSDALISDASLSGRAIYRHINRSLVAQRLSDLFPNATILLFIRGQEKALHSIYNQYVKGSRRGTLPMNEYFITNYNGDYDSYYVDEKFHVELLKFSHLIALYKALFKRVEVFLYEDVKNNKEEVLNRLENILDQRFTDEQRERILGSSKVNPSIDTSMIYKRRVVNSLERIPMNGVLWSIARAFLRRLASNSSSEELPVKNDYFKEDNKKIIELYPEIGLTRYPEDYKI